MSTGVALGCAAGAAGLFSVSTALKHRSAQQPAELAESARAHGIGAVATMTTAMLTHPSWLAGAVADVGGLALQVIALHLGGLLLVQPVLVTAVAGSLVATALLQRRRPPRRQLVWAAAMIVALVAFLTPLELNGALRPVSADRSPSYFLAGLGAALIVVAVTFARLRGHGRVAASALGAATGLLYAAAAALITVVSVQFSRAGLSRVLSRDEVYVLLVVGALSQVLNQAAFAAADLSASVPVTTAVDLLVSVLLGVVVFDQPLPRNVLALVLAGFGLALACVATFALTSTPRSTQPA